MSFAQAPDTLWTRDLSLSYDWTSLFDAEEHNNTFVAVGGAYDSAYGRALAICVTTSGDTLWHRLYGAGELDEAHALVKAFDGGLVACGFTSSFGFWGDIWILHLSTAGDTNWTRSYHYTGDGAWDIVRTRDSCYATIANIDATPGNGRTPLLLKLNMNGDSIWSRRFPTIDNAFALSQTSDDGFVIAASTRSYPARMAIVKTDSSGNFQWQRLFGDSINGHMGFAVADALDQGLILAGTELIGEGDMFCARLSTFGDSLWSRVFENTGGQGARCVVTLADGFLFGGDGMRLVRTTASGEVIWNQTYDELSWGQTAYECLPTSDGGFLLVGAGSMGRLVKVGPECAVVTPASPEVVITTLGLDAHLQWAAVDTSVGGCPVSELWYAVFYSPTSGGPFYYHGWTPDTVYTHSGVVNFSPTQFYQVVAVDAPAAVAMELEPGMEMNEVMRKVGGRENRR